MSKTLVSVIDIQAPTVTVWAVLTDFPAYPDWNPIEIEMYGEPVVGTRLQHTSKLPGRKPMRFTPTIVAAEPGRVLAWDGRVLVPHLFDVHHRFELSPAATDGTRLRQSERFSGLLVPFLTKTLRQTQEAFEIANQAIKSRAETIANTPRP
ncbi:MAG TPA: SRPBCC domain-containing protein [Acidimicrobiales bacterium]